jgi:cytoskeleton protein RodZ
MGTITPDPLKTTNDGDRSVDSNADDIRNIGNILKTARELRNENIKQVSNILRIRQVYLEAIENNQFDALPGSVYIIGFIRTYSDYLGLDADELIQNYKSGNLANAKNSKLDFPSGVKEHSIPSGVIIMLGLMLSAIGYGSWYYISSKSVVSTEQVTSVPDKLTSLTTGKAKLTDKESASNLNIIDSSSNLPNIVPSKNIPTNTEKFVKKTDETVVIDKKVEPQSLNLDIPSELAKKNITKNPQFTKKNPIDVVEEKKLQIKTPDLDLATDPPTKQPDEEPLESKLQKKVKPMMMPEAVPEITNLARKKLKTASTSQPSINVKQNEETDSRITLRAVNDSYIQVRDNEANQLLVTRLLKQGDTYQVPNRPGLSLITGNAGALNILVDGKIVPSIGSAGIVRRNVVLDAQRLITGSAVVE